MPVEVKESSIDSDEDQDSETDRIAYLSKFVSKLMNAPQKKGIEMNDTPIVDVMISLEEIRIITVYASASFSTQNTLIRIDESCLPAHVVGDLHGQFHDLRMIFAKCGDPSTTTYVFLGDYVDRGMQGLESAMLLIALQTLYPSNIFLCRGNHEDYNTTLTYGFYDECKVKYGKMGELVWLHMISAFNHLPFAALIIDKVLCMHGGISPHLKTLDDIDNIARPTFIPSFGLACDLVWSDPEFTQNPGYSLSARGISFSFDQTTIETFCQENEIDTIIRAHQITSDMYRGGHKFHAGGRMITIFSAPNYLNMGNDSCVARIDQSKKLKFIVMRPQRVVKNKVN